MVVAAGAWSGDLLAHSLGHDMWRSIFKPRRGHLLEVQAPPSMPPLQHGLMEIGYTQVCLLPYIWQTIFFGPVGNHLLLNVPR